MRRVSVVGNSGSGKTTVARAIASRLGIRVFELDAIVHQPGWVELPTPEFRRSVEACAAQEAWVIDGNYSSRVQDLVWSRADTVVWLDLPRRVVVTRVVRRTVGRVILRKKLWNGNREPWSNPGREVLRRVERLGCQSIRQRGSHVIVRCRGGCQTVIPVHTVARPPARDAEGD